MGGDRATLAMARQELEDLYLGIPGESVDLTLKDLPGFGKKVAAEKKAVHAELDHARDEPPSIKVAKRASSLHKAPSFATESGPRVPDSKESASAALRKSPSLDFARGLEETREHQRQLEGEVYREQLGWKGSSRQAAVRSMAYDDISGFSVGAPMSPYLQEGQVTRRRPGIPHSNICALCSVYIYVFRHRCLVCGRAYCRSCVRGGMGEMAEGRKCVECLGKRFSQRYIQKAGHTGCLCNRYSSAVKQQELMWAEKGPRKNGERPYGRNSIMLSRGPMSPMSPRTPTKSHLGNEGSSFVMNKTYSPTSHGFPL